MTLKKYFPGICVLSIIGVVAFFLSYLIPNIGSVTLAIITGIFFGNIIKKRESLEHGVAFSVSKVLPAAIVCLGVELQLNILLNLGLPAIILVILMVSGTISIGFITGRIMGFNSRFSLLMGCGNAICGSSAIAAVAPVIGNDENEIGLSVGVVNLMGTFGIFILPLAAHFLNFSEMETAGLIGGMLQAVGQVVASGYSVNENVGNISVIIKMGRVLMLGPVAAILSIVLSNSGKGEAGKSGKVVIPKFIIGFFIFSFLSSYGIFTENITGIIKITGKSLLLISMAGIGMQIKFSSLLQQGPKVLKLEIVIVLFQFILAGGLAHVLL